MESLTDDNIKIELSHDEALVLFEAMHRFSESEKLSIEDDSEKWVFYGLLALLEKQLVDPFNEDYNVLLQKARGEICRIHEYDK